MKIATISDIHYEQNKETFNKLPKDFFKPQADILIINGDCCDGIENLDLVLDRFSNFNGHIIFNTGNHELWTKKGGDSIELYKEIIPDKLIKYGIHYLPSSNFILDDYAIVGEMGWFDFSYKKSVPKDVKILEGCNGHFNLENNIFKQRELKDYDFERGNLVYKIGERLLFSVNKDVKNVSKNLNHKKFTDFNINNLENKILDAPSTKKIVLVTHFVPAGRFIQENENSFYISAFLGTNKMEPILQNPQISLIIFGHQHKPTSYIEGSRRIYNFSFSIDNPYIMTIEL